MNPLQDTANAPDNTALDQNLDNTHRIGEVADMLGLKSYVLRFWESEFPQLDPLRTEKGQRLYTTAHVTLLRRIQTLLHEEGMTIEGARRVLENEREQLASLANLVPLRAVQTPAARDEMLREFALELEQLKELLQSGSI